jgi:hypothetical protein
LGQYRPADRLLLSWLRCCASLHVHLTVSDTRPCQKAKRRSPFAVSRLDEVSTGKHRPPKPRPESRPSHCPRQRCQGPKLPQQAFPCPAQGASSAAQLAWALSSLTPDNRFSFDLFSPTRARNISSSPLSFTYRYCYRRLSRRLSSSQLHSFIHSYIWAHLVTASSSRPSPSSPVAIDPAGFHLTFR